MGSLGGIEVLFNGDFDFDPKDRIELIGVKELEELAYNPVLEMEYSKTVSKKGYGLKKWRRKERGFWGDNGLDLKDSVSMEEKNERKSNSDRESLVESRSSTTIGNLDLDLDFLILATGFSLGIGSKNSENCCNKMAAIVGAPRKRSRAVTRRSTRWNKEVDDLTQHEDVLSDGQQSEVLMNCDEVLSEGQQSWEVQSTYTDDCGSNEDLARAAVGMDQPRESMEESEDSSLHQDDDPFVELMVSLQETQEELENEIRKFSEFQEEPELEASYGDQKRKDISSSSDPETHMLELNQKMKDLEQKLDGASTAIREKDARLLELEVLNRNNKTNTEFKSTGTTFLEEKLNLESKLESLFQERMETEIQCIIMSRATQSWQLRTEDRVAFLEEHKSLTGEHTRTMIKLKDTENKVFMLQEQVQKKEIREKELRGTAEALTLQKRTSKVSLFCFIQLIMLCIALSIFSSKTSPPFGEVVVPT